MLVQHPVVWTSEECRRLDESPKLAARHQESAAVATYHVAIVFLRVGVDHGRRTAIARQTEPCDHSICSSGGRPVSDRAIIKIVASCSRCRSHGCILCGLFPFSELRKPHPRFRKIEGKGPMFGMLQLCRKPVAIMGPFSEFRPPWHYSSPALQTPLNAKRM
jgi:hypothetical protein